MRLNYEPTEVAWYDDNIQLLGNEVFGQTVCAEATAFHFVHGANTNTRLRLVRVCLVVLASY